MKLILTLSAHLNAALRLIAEVQTRMDKYDPAGQDLGQFQRAPLEGAEAEPAGQGGANRPACWQYWT